MCAALVPVLHAWAALLFLVLYNGVHLTLRARFYWMGLALGDRLVEAVARATCPPAGRGCARWRRRAPGGWPPGWRWT